MTPSRLLPLGAVIGALLGGLLLIAVMPRGIAPDRAEPMEAPTLEEGRPLQPHPSELASLERQYLEMLEDSLNRVLRPEDRARVRYNLGTVTLAARRFEEAVEHLEIAAQGMPASERHFAHFNLGNSDLFPAYADTLLPEREARLRRSIQAYKAALLLDPADLDAKWNLELARRLLDGELPPASGGGGGGGGGRDGPPEQGENQPSPTPSAGPPGPQPRMSAAEADELLRAAQERELEVQRESLRKPQSPGPIRP